MKIILLVFSFIITPLLYAQINRPSNQMTTRSSFLESTWYHAMQNPPFLNNTSALSPSVKPGKSGYIDTLYPVRKCTYFHDVIDCDSAFYVSGYTHGERLSANFDPNHIILPIRMKINYSGNVLWTRTDSLMYGDHFVMYNKSLIQLADGNFLQMGMVRNDYVNWKNYDWNATSLVKFNPDGNTIWTKLEADTGYMKSCDWGQDIIPEEDGGFTMVTLKGSDSKTYSTDTLNNYWFTDTTYVGLLRYDAQGNLIQRKHHFIGGDKVMVTLGLVMKQADGGYLIGGENNFAGTKNNFFFFKTDSMFNWEWTKLFSQTIGFRARMHLAKLLDNNFAFSVMRADTPIVVLGGQTYFNSYHHTGFTDSGLNILKDSVFLQRFFPPSHPYYELIYDWGDIRGMAVDEINKSIYLLSFTGYGANLIKLGYDLSIKWNRWIADFPYFTEEPFKLRQVHDGGFAIVGMTWRMAQGGWFVKTDTNGFALPNGADTLYHIGIGEHSGHTISLKVYPNPAHDQLYIEFSELPKTNIEIKILDITGRLLSNRLYDSSFNLVQDLSWLNEGCYIVQVSLQGGYGKSFKIVKY